MLMFMPRNFIMRGNRRNWPHAEHRAVTALKPSSWLLDQSNFVVKYRVWRTLSKPLGVSCSINKTQRDTIDALLFPSLFLVKTEAADFSLWIQELLVAMIVILLTLMAPM